MISRHFSDCSSCFGTGEQMAPEDACRSCNGTRLSSEKRDILVHVEPGMEPGDRLTFQQCADEEPGAETGDLVVIIVQKPHDRFVRNHSELLVSKSITLTEALFGTTFVVKQLDGRNLVVRSADHEVIVPKMVKVIENEGMPHRGNAFQKGNLFVAFDVVFPMGSQITRTLKEVYVKVLPPPDEVDQIDMDDENTYLVAMTDSEIKHFERARSRTERRREAYNDDDEEEETYSHGSTCTPM
jgi:DnaJ family protein A protein 2